MRLAGPAIWALFGLACAGSALWTMRTHGHSTAMIVAYDIAVWAGWCALTYVVIWLGRRVPLLPFRVRGAAIHVAAAIVIGLVHQMWWCTLLVVLRPYDAMGPTSILAAFQNELVDELFFEGVIYFAVLGVTYAIDYQRRLREREVRAAQLEASLAKARMTALELQLQPHFLFNTLHAIGGLVRQARGKEAIEMIAGLSDLLRYALDHAGQHTVPLDRELAITERYLAIQQQRFSDRLVVMIDAPASTRDLLVPAMMLQPLVENAVKHGIERASEGGSIVVTARELDGWLELQVFNPGVLGEVESGIGVANTRERLHQLYGASCTFELRGEANGVTATVRLRAQRVQPSSIVMDAVA
jgi:hypothetical protein